MADYNASIEQWKKQVSIDLAQVAKQAIFKISYKIIEDTPVDVGFLRGNWQPSISSPSDVKPDETVRAGALVMANLSFALDDLEFGDIFYFTNVTAYALRVERGFVGEDSLGRYYNQAGQYFVAKNVINWQNFVNEAALEVASK